MVHPDQAVVLQRENQSVLGMRAASFAGDRGSPGARYPSRQPGGAEGRAGCTAGDSGEAGEVRGKPAPLCSTTTFSPTQNPAKKLPSGASRRPARPGTV